MKNLLNQLRKFNTPLHRGIISMIFGVAFIVLPYRSPLALNILIAAAGLFVIFVGILTIAELDFDTRGILYYLSLAKTVALILAGIVIIVSRTALAGWLCLGYGIYILIRTVPVLIASILLPELEEKSWWVRMVITVLEITLGTWLVFSPEWPNLYILAGVTLIVIAVECFIKHTRNDPDTPYRTVSGGTIYDTDFEDKT